MNATASEAMDEYVANHHLPECITQSAYLAYRGLLADGLAFIDYQPGDGTSYKLTLTRIIAPLNIAPKAKPTGNIWGCRQDGSFVMVGWMDHGCYPFSLLDQDTYFDAGYVASKFDDNIATGLALAALFNRIQEVHETSEVTWQIGTTDDGFEYRSPVLS